LLLPVQYKSTALAYSAHSEIHFTTSQSYKQRMESWYLETQFWRCCVFIIKC